MCLKANPRTGRAAAAGGGHFVSLNRCERGLQAVVNGYQFETLDLLSSEYECREMNCIHRSNDFVGPTWRAISHTDGLN